MELDFDKYCVVDGSPTTVLPAPRRHSRVSCRKSNEKVKCGNDLLRHKEEFSEIRFSRHRSASCRDVQSRKIVEEDDQLLKRGSVYQSSKQVRLQITPNDVERKKIEFSQVSASTFSFGIMDSLCSLVEERNSSEQYTSSSCRNQDELHSLDPINQSFCPIPERTASLSTLSSSKSKRQVANNQSRGVMSLSKYAVSELNDNNISLESDAVFSLQKSLSAKLALPHSDTDGSKTSSLRASLNPVLKMLDPFYKSRYNRSKLNHAKETVFESLLNDLSDKAPMVGNSPQLGKKDDHNSHSLSSPAHLHGLLKMERKHGVPFFEFSVKSPEDVYVAKTCKVDNPLTWAYTFHSLHHRRKSSSTAWGFRENIKESSLVGQMLVSCYLCTDLKGAGAFNDSMVTEFVLYDVAHSRRSISSQDSSGCSPDLSKLPLVSDEILSWRDEEKNEISAKTKKKCQSKHSCDSDHYKSSQPVELHPGLESAAMIMQVPFEKRAGSLSFKNGGRAVMNCEQNGKMHVVIPAGNHSLPSSDNRGPSPLLDRWRVGGGCDCGGWDMACPLNVCGNPNFDIAEIDSRHPVQLFVQGRKDNIAAFTMREMEDGKYAVDFHAQLSSLQAFSICVSILHSRQERSKQMLQSDSMRVCAEEEIKHFVEEEKLKGNQMEGGLPSFVINPPFSPIDQRRWKTPFLYPKHSTNIPYCLY